MTRSRVIVDGYNLLHAHPVHRASVRADIDASRARLVADLAGFAEGGPRTIVVFDGAGNPYSDGAPHHLGALTVIFSAADTSADAVIESLSRRYRERGEEVLVVTSDAATRDTVASGSVNVVSSEQFAGDLVAEHAERSVRSPSASRRVPVAARIRGDIAATLAGWARGEES